jgi:hypothetical protein
VIYKYVLLLVSCVHVGYARCSVFNVMYSTCVVQYRVSASSSSASVKVTASA